MKKLLIIFTITILTFLNLYSWNSQAFVFSNSKLDPAWTIEDFSADIINNPAQLNNLQNRYLHLGAEVSKDNHKSGIYAHDFQKFKLAISINDKVNSSKLQEDISNDSNFGLTMGRTNYGISYRYSSRNVEYTRISETDYSIEETENEEPVLNLTKEERFTDDEYRNHAVSIGWMKELKSGKKLDFVSSLGLINKDIDSNLNYERNIDKDPDGDGEFGGFYDYYSTTIINETARRISHIDSECSLLTLSSFLRIMDDRKKEKLKTWSAGVSYSMIVDDETLGNGVDSLYTETIELENFITDSSKKEYFWNEKEERRFSFFIAKGIHWKKWKKLDILFSNKILSDYGIITYHSTTNDKKKTTEFELDLKSYLSTTYRASDKITLKAGWGINMDGRSYRSKLDSNILTNEFSRNFSLKLQGGYLAGCRYQPKDNLVFDLSYSNINIADEGRVIIEMKYLF